MCIRDSSIEEAAERHGVSLMMLNAYQKQEKQIDAIRSFSSYRVDVISFAPIVEDGWDTVRTEARTAGIPGILVDRLITTQDESLYACFVGADLSLIHISMPSAASFITWGI